MSINENIKQFSHQAPNRANTLLLDAIESIDIALGTGYDAAKHSELIAAYLNAASADNSAVVESLKKLNDRLHSINSSISDLTDRVY